MQFETQLLSVRDEAKDIKTFLFEKPADFEYKAGQYAHFDLLKLTHPDARGLSHHFSFSSSPTEDHISFTTKIRQESGYKQTFCELTKGANITVRGPGGQFILNDEDTSVPQVMIAGGIGVTPYRSIIKYVVDNSLVIPIHLIYSATTAEEFAFKAEFDSFTQSNPNFTVSYIVTHPEGSVTPWSGYTGRLDEMMMQQFVPDLESSVFLVKRATKNG
jgi:ferredoxin-NADP reductase